MRRAIAIALCCAACRPAPPPPPARDDPPPRFTDRFEHVYGRHDGFRRNHAKGLSATGTFASSGAAASALTVTVTVSTVVLVPSDTESSKVMSEFDRPSGAVKVGDGMAAVECEHVVQVEDPARDNRGGDRGRLGDRCRRRFFGRTGRGGCGIRSGLGDRVGH